MDAGRSGPAILWASAVEWNGSKVLRRKRELTLALRARFHSHSALQRAIAQQGAALGGTVFATFDRKAVATLAAVRFESTDPAEPVE